MKWLFLLLIGSMSFSAMASLYEAQVPVNDQSDQQREIALAQAFSDVVLKITGKELSVEAPKLLAQLDRYVAQHGYVSKNNQQHLKVLFDQAQMDVWLQQHQLQKWSGHRPSVLIWLAIESEGQRRLFHPELDQGLPVALQEISDKRGMSLFFPLMDIQDQSSVILGDLWGGFHDPVKQASVRYSADILVVAKLKQLSESNWDADWQWLGKDQESWISQGQTKEAALSKGVNNLLGKINRYYQATPRPARQQPAVAGNTTPLASNSIKIAISGVNSLHAYNQVKGFMQGLSSADQAKIKSSRGDVLIYEISLSHSIDQLKQELSLGGVLVFESGHVDSEQADLFYRVVF